MLINIFTSENIGYASCILCALLGITVAVIFLLKKQDEGSKMLKWVAIVLIVVSVSAAVVSTQCMRLCRQLQEQKNNIAIGPMEMIRRKYVLTTRDFKDDKKAVLDTMKSFGPRKD